MKGFIIGTVFGIVLCTVGLSGIARMFDNGVSKVQQVTKEAAQ
jgi:flagellar biosynthesis protein FliR